MIGTPRSLAAFRWSPARMPRPPEILREHLTGDAEFR